MPSNNIAFARNYTSVIDEVYQRASVSGVLNSGRRMVRAGHNAKEILIPKISVTGLGNYTRNVGYKTGAITYEFETKTFNYDRGIRLFADVMDVEEAGVELQRTQVAPEADAFTFAQIAGHTGVTVTPEDLSEATATGILQALREVTSAMAEAHVRWLCELRGADETSERFMRAVCAALEAFAEYGAGEVGGYTIGEFSVRNYASQQTTGEELATGADGVLTDPNNDARTWF